MTDKSYCLNQWFLIRVDFQIHLATIGNYTAICSVLATAKPHFSLEGTDYHCL